MDAALTLAPFALLAIAVVLVYLRFRDKFSNLAVAIDSKRSNLFWTILALIYAVVIAALYIFRTHAHTLWRPK
jgi:hypothetical protein